MRSEAEGEMSESIKDCVCVSCTDEGRMKVTEKIKSVDLAMQTTTGSVWNGVTSDDRC